MTCNKRKSGMMKDQEFKNKKLKTLAPIPTRVVVEPDVKDGWHTRKLITGDETLASIVYKESEEVQDEVYMIIDEGSPDHVELLLKGFQESLGHTLIFVRSLYSEEYTKNVYGAVLERLNFVEEDSDDNSTVWACDHNNGYVSC
jgi:hypothetical protein